MKMICGRAMVEKGPCVGNLVLVDRIFISASCCDTCGAFGYLHLSKEQLWKNMHRNEDLKEEYFERCFMEDLREEAIKKKNNAKIAEDAAKAAAIKKRSYIECVDAQHVTRLDFQRATADYLANCCHTLRKEGDNYTKGVLLEALSTYDIKDKMKLLLESGLPGVIKRLSLKTRNVDKKDETVRVLAQDIKNMWKIRMRARMAAASNLAPADIPASCVVGTGKRTARESTGDMEKQRIVKKFNKIVSGK